MSYKILVAGAGSIGTRHLKNLLKLGYKNFVVCEPDEKKLKTVAGLGDFALYKNVKIALKTETPDVVFVCNPTHLHVQTANLALDYGAHVFIEKPLSHNLNGVDALIKKAKAKKRTVMVACNWRFHEGFKKLKELLDSNKYGKPILSRVFGGYYLPTARKNVNYKKIYAAGTKGGGVIIDSGAHGVDYLENFFGKTKYVTALKRTAHVLDIKSEEAAIIGLEHENGVISAIVTDYVSRKSNSRIEVITEKGILSLDVTNDTLYFEDENKNVLLFRGVQELNHMFMEEVRHFLGCVKNRSKPAQDLSAAKHVLKVLFAAYYHKPKKV
ncbi:MAG: Gfo/Idh/MocA family oxidoreductase [bacterium]|nr:Gfo/Idh/MocA family oxidoreductase [bacterium]